MSFEIFLNCIKHFEKFFDVFFEVLKNWWKKIFSVIELDQSLKKALIFIY
jgi:hypothetical protein